MRLTWFIVVVALLLLSPFLKQFPWHQMPFGSLSGSRKLHPPARFNFAGCDVGAKVVDASPNSKGASRVISDDRDRYMLAPCHGDHFVTIQLSEEILVDAVVVANFEHFASSPKQLTINSAREFPPARWESLGNFTIQPTHQEQPLAIATPQWALFVHSLLLSFCIIYNFRFVRLDINSHYGHEKLCSLSQIKVYGRTQVDLFREESEREERLSLRSPPTAPLGSDVLPPRLAPLPTPSPPAVPASPILSPMPPVSRPPLTAFSSSLLAPMPQSTPDSGTSELSASPGPPSAADAGMLRATQSWLDGGDHHALFPRFVAAARGSDSMSDESSHEIQHVDGPLFRHSTAIPAVEKLSLLTDEREATSTSEHVAVIGPSAGASPEGAHPTHAVSAEDSHSPWPPPSGSAPPPTPTAPLATTAVDALSPLASAQLPSDDVPSFDQSAPPREVARASSVGVAESCGGSHNRTAFEPRVPANNSAGHEAQPRAGSTRTCPCNDCGGSDLGGTLCSVSFLLDGPNSATSHCCSTPFAANALLAKSARCSSVSPAEVNSTSADDLASAAALCLFASLPDMSEWPDLGYSAPACSSADLANATASNHSNPTLPDGGASPLPEPFAASPLSQTSPTPLIPPTPTIPPAILAFLVPPVPPAPPPVSEPAARVVAEDAGTRKEDAGVRSSGSASIGTEASRKESTRPLGSADDLFSGPPRHESVFHGLSRKCLSLRD